MKTSFNTMVLVVVFILTLLNTKILASELVHGFKNPAFSGDGYSNHVLSVDQLQEQRKQKKIDDAKSAAAAASDLASASLSFFLCDCNWSTDNT